MDILNKKITDIITKYPFIEGYFVDNESIYKDFNISVIDNLNALCLAEKEDNALDKEEIISHYTTYFKELKSIFASDDERIESLTILAGTNKLKEEETFGSLTMETGKIYAIVGPTGSGKSRLLADIEWLANKDTPTNRKILINGEEPEKKWRFESSNKLVAQLSQNMNFVIDLSVYEFIELHCTSRLIENKEEKIEKILNQANKLAGEPFDKDTPVTSLSGGQSRALMIADTAILSASPIVLIDEIENAGIDRKKALSLLVKEEKIVLIATHDPILALMTDERIVIENGGISKIILTSDKERALLSELEKIDSYMMGLRQKIRFGEVLSENDLIWKN